MSLPQRPQDAPLSGDAPTGHAGDERTQAPPPRPSPSVFERDARDLRARGIELRRGVAVEVLLARPRRSP